MPDEDEEYLPAPFYDSIEPYEEAKEDKNEEDENEEEQN